MQVVVNSEVEINFDQSKNNLADQILDLNYTSDLVDVFITQATVKLEDAKDTVAYECEKDEKQYWQKQVNAWKEFIKAAKVFKKVCIKMENVINE